MRFELEIRALSQFSILNCFLYFLMVIAKHQEIAALAEGHYTIL